MKLMVLNSSGSNKSSSDKKEETNTTAAADAKEVAAQVWGGVCYYEVNQRSDSCTNNEMILFQVNGGRWWVSSIPVLSPESSRGRPEEVNISNCCLLFTSDSWVVWSAHFSFFLTRHMNKRAAGVIAKKQKVFRVSEDHMAAGLFLRAERLRRSKAV